MVFIFWIRGVEGSNPSYYYYGCIINMDNQRILRKSPEPNSIYILLEKNIENENSLKKF